MSQESKPNEITKKKVVYEIAGMEDVIIRRDVEYRTTDAGPLAMDLYYPPDSKNETRLPAVIFVLGYSDLGFQMMFGSKLKDMGSYVSWAQLTAVSGLVAITYATTEPVGDIDALLQYVRQNAASLGIDEKRIGVWSSSGNAPTALSILMQDGQDYLKCAVLCNGVTLDLDGSTRVAQLASMYKFANPGAGKSVDDLPQDLPLFIVRSGQDQTPGLNEALDRFVAKALAGNRPITLVNHSTAPHWFEVMDDSETSREIIRQVLAFMRLHLLG